MGFAVEVVSGASGAFTTGWLVTMGLVVILSISCWDDENAAGSSKPWTNI